MIQHSISRLVLYSFALYGVLWTIVESVGAYFPTVKPQGIESYLWLVGASVLLGLVKAFPRLSVRIKVPNSDSTLTIEFGDIFKKDGCIAIPVNEYFDSELGNHVSPVTLHGMFIRDKLGGVSTSFNSLVDGALASEKFKQVSRSSGRDRRYQIGTTASVDLNGKRYLLFVLSKTDLTTLKASASVHDLWDSISGLWSAVRIKSNGYPVYIPLVGSGQSGVGLPPIDILEMIISSFFYHTKEGKICGNMTIVLHKSNFTEIDLQSIRQLRR